MNRWLHYVQDIAWAFIIIFFSQKIIAFLECKGSVPSVSRSVRVTGG